MNTMDQSFTMLEATRTHILHLLNECSDEQLFVIPRPFNNHLLWNALHLLAAQQKLCYELAEVPLRLDRFMVERYAKGTFPSQERTGDLVRFAKEHLMSTVHEMKADYFNGVFSKPYRQMTTSYGVTLSGIEDAIHYLNIHESLHFGQMKMMKKLIE